MISTASKMIYSFLIILVAAGVMGAPTKEAVLGPEPSVKQSTSQADLDQFFKDQQHLVINPYTQIGEKDDTLSSLFGRPNIVSILGQLPQNNQADESLDLASTINQFNLPLTNPFSLVSATGFFNQILCLVRSCRN